jgi:hypothetical protein
MKAYEGVEVEIHTFVTSEVERGEWSPSCLGCCTPRERSPKRIGHWLGLRAGLDSVEKREISYSCQELNPDS